MKEITDKVSALRAAGFEPVRINMSYDLHQMLVERQTRMMSGKAIAISVYNGLPVSILPAPNHSKLFTVEV